MPGFSYFNPRSPCGERLPFPWLSFRGWSISIPAPRVGSDHNKCYTYIITRISIPAPRVGSDCGLSVVSGVPPSISIPAPRVGSDCLFVGVRPRISISIPAPRVGSDIFPAAGCLAVMNFNPRSPCGERPLLDRVVMPEITFQSPLPVWGATHCHGRGWCRRVISIPAPRVGSDFGLPDYASKATEISIPAPRVGSDPLMRSVSPAARYFNPRSPCGERRLGRSSLFLREKISIPAPRVGSDFGVPLCYACTKISIPAPRVGSDGTGRRK